MSTTGPFNTDNHFGTIRMNANSQGKLQEALNLHNPIHKIAQRPTNKPPPPPVPNRLPGTNLTNNHAKSTNALNLSTGGDNGLSVPRRIPNSGSSNNISNLSQVDQIDAPPLPPHRVSSQSQMRVQQAAPPAGNVLPPEVPRRHSSMRNSIEVSANGKSNSVNNSVMSLVVDLEERYQLMFHKVSEFPLPKPYLNLNKNYPSRASMRQQNGI